jgi:hypothetical protein
VQKNDQNSRRKASNRNCCSAGSETPTGTMGYGIFCPSVGADRFVGTGAEIGATPETTYFLLRQNEKIC